MIMCSKRVFLNVLTQLMDLNSLLNANYFILDARPTVGSTGVPWDENSGLPKLNEYGELCYDSTPSLDFTRGSTMTKYFIKYEDVLNPAPYLTILQAGIHNDYSTPMEKYKSYLMQTDTQIAVYQFLFMSKLQGNGLQILIMTDDQSMEDFGDLIAQYLSQVFGADITFLDPKYRPKTRGQLQYSGNKAFAEKHIRELRDVQMLANFQQAVSSARFGNATNNLMQFLNPMEFEQLIYLYNKLFPEAPLQPGRYTTDHIKRIIIGRVLQSIGVDGKEDMWDVPWSAFDEMAGLYSPEADFSDIS
ncbi:MAG: hypothetical protein J5614_03675 [Paludibacteraceae bacterium]|nr:hypothetical protein [Paludibacteraceae bacterium]